MNLWWKADVVGLHGPILVEIDRLGGIPKQSNFNLEEKKS